MSKKPKRRGKRSNKGNGVGEEYTCSLCQGIFNKGRSDAESLEESRSYFGDVPAEELAIICEDCWQKIHPDRN
ncbi:MAG: hypothetical protein KGL39_10710 [Patescibacteria group bacterium]|nr:hypothetical protein [Patescibacteria group bacterium]